MFVEKSSIKVIWRLHLYCSFYLAGFLTFPHQLNLPICWPLVVSQQFAKSTVKVFFQTQINKKRYEASFVFLTLYSELAIYKLCLFSSLALLTLYISPSQKHLINKSEKGVKN